MDTHMWSDMRSLARSNISIQALGRRPLWMWSVVDRSVTKLLCGFIPPKRAHAPPNCCNWKTANLLKLLQVQRAEACAQPLRSCLNSYNPRITRITQRVSGGLSGLNVGRL